MKYLGHVLGPGPYPLPGPVTVHPRHTQAVEVRMIPHTDGVGFSAPPVLVFK